MYQLENNPLLPEEEFDKVILDEGQDGVEDEEMDGLRELTDYDVDPNQMSDLDAEDMEQLRELIRTDNFKASANDFADFMRTPVWDDIATNLMERITSLRTRLENLSSNPQEDLINKARIHELRMLLSYPLNVIKTLNIGENSNEEVA